MAMIKCGECQKEISSTAENCPYCGARTARGGVVAAAKVILVQWVIAVIIMLVGVIALLVNFSDYMDLSEHMEYYKYFSDDEKSTVIWFWVGVVALIVGVIDIIIIGSQARKMRYQAEMVSTYSRPSGSDYSFAPPRSGSTASNNIPTWKRIEMEEAEKAKAAQEQARKESQCAFCGAEIPEGSKFCGACGRKKN